MLCSAISCLAHPALSLLLPIYGFYDKVAASALCFTYLFAVGCRRHPASRRCFCLWLLCALCAICVCVWLLFRQIAVVDCVGDAFRWYRKSMAHCPEPIVNTRTNIRAAHVFTLAYPPISVRPSRINQFLYLWLMASDAIRRHQFFTHFHRSAHFVVQHRHTKYTHKWSQHNFHFIRARESLSRFICFSLSFLHFVAVYVGHRFFCFYCYQCGAYRHTICSFSLFCCIGTQSSRKWEKSTASFGRFGPIASKCMTKDSVRYAVICWYLPSPDFIDR